MTARKHYISASGSVLPFAMMAIVILTLIGLALIRLGTNARLTAAYEVSEISARAAADAGLVRSVDIMNTLLQNKTLDKNNLPKQLTPVYLPTSFGNAYYTYLTSYDTATTTYRISSTGIAGHRSQTVNTVLGIKSAITGLGAKESIDVKSNITFATVPEDTYFAVMTNSTTPPPAGGISLKTNVAVPGDVIVGPGGDPDELVDTKKDTVIDGDSFAGPGFDMPDIPVPSYLKNAAPPAGTATSITSSGKLSSINVGTNKTFTVGGDPANTNIELYIDGPVNLNTGATLQILPGYSLTIYLGGNYDGGNNSDVRNENPATSDAEKVLAAKSFTLYGLPTCTSIKLNAKSDFYGLIYAPQASLTLYNDGDIYGAIAAYDMEFKNSTNFIYIAELGIINETNPTAYFAIDRWWED